MDANTKPSLPKEVLAKADIDVLSHNELLDAINRLYTKDQYLIGYIRKIILITIYWES